MRYALFAACLAALFTIPSSAADANGRYWNGGGVGAGECPTFVSTMERARRFGLGTVGYVTEIHGYAMFLAGFQTA